MEKSAENNVWQDRRHILWFPITFDCYQIANSRIYCKHGFIKQEEHECLLYRVLDISLTRTVWNRICKTGTIVMRTRDASDSILILKNIKDSQRVKNMISDMVEDEKRATGVMANDAFVGSRNRNADAAYDGMTE